ncbi:ABC transporter ATP-binding protein [Ruegeria atlantica]|uniref:ABC transporter ATP-binding protein n=1 Tax=Ruegeria atlantica TaxID=81569 RepID=UPI00147C54B1|nr:ABC transporter ATP-binding protein [Ruegeria atlantica]
MSNKALEVTNLSAGYGENDVLQGIDLTIPPKSITALIGANGAGKTTFLKTVTGLLPGRTGSIKLFGEELTSKKPYKIAEAGFALSPEGKQLFPEMTVEENLIVGAHNVRARSARNQTLEEVYSLFSILKEKRNDPAASLSGGQQQMVAVGRALMAKPKVLALDEPSLGLAPIMVDRLFESIARIRELDLAILIIEQNVFQVLEMADYGYVLENGEVTISGTGSELLANDHLKRAYLGL